MYTLNESQHPWWPDQPPDPAPDLEGRDSTFPQSESCFDAQILYAYASPATRQRALELTRDRTLPPRAQATLAPDAAPRPTTAP